MFADADANQAILFFDEADALFGKRSEVKDAHDRYANIELELPAAADGGVRRRRHPGDQPARQNLDDAFVRRLRFIVSSLFPTKRIGGGCGT